MNKRRLSSWYLVEKHAAARAAKSRKRKDPIAMAYWMETEKYARNLLYIEITRENLLERARDCVAMAKERFQEQKFMEGALYYSRAKWCVIIGRAKGFIMNPKTTGVNLAWLDDLVTGLESRDTGSTKLCPGSAVG